MQKDIKNSRTIVRKGKWAKDNLPPVLVTLTMRPFDCLMNGRKAFVTRRTPKVFTSHAFWNSSTDVQSTCPQCAMPALFTTAHKARNKGRKKE